MLPTLVLTVPSTLIGTCLVSASLGMLLLPLNREFYIHVRHQMVPAYPRPEPSGDGLRRKHGPRKIKSDALGLPLRNQWRLKRGAPCVIPLTLPRPMTKSSRKATPLAPSGGSRLGRNNGSSPALRGPSAPIRLRPHSGGVSTDRCLCGLPLPRLGGRNRRRPLRAPR